MDKKDKKDFITPEIAKLTERLAENPKSKLFLPLGEEYMKCNLLEEAITVLEDGLKIYPSYLSAMVLLGKVYLQKEMIGSAKALFEDVIEKNYDNILAHKQLINIFRSEGNKEKALLSCRAVFAINPDDMEIKSILEELELEIGVKDEVFEEACPVSSSVDTDIGSSSDGLTTTEEESREEGGITADEEKTEEEETPKVFEIDEDDLLVSNDDYSIEISEDKDTDLPLDEEIPAHPLESSTEVEPAIDTPDEIFDLTETEEEIEDTVIENPDKYEGEVESDDEIVTDTLGDLYIKQGYYEKGIEIYKKVLESEPDNQEVEQKLKEAVRIADLINKGNSEETEEKSIQEDESIQNEELFKTQKVQSLQRWLENIKRRRDNEL